MNIIYIEDQAREYQLTQEICEIFPNAQKVYIKHYKNLFDKQIPYKHKKSLLLAKQTWNVLLPVPESYWYWSTSYFLRTALNCLFDCEYCYLKWAFRTDIPAIFVNTDEMQTRVRQEIEENWHDDIWLYPSNWTDLLASEFMTHFHRDWIPFFETLQNIQVESRTKAISIDPLISMNAPKKTEMAYSLNPQEIIDMYESWTPSLQKRIKAINILLKSWWKVWLRIMPLIPIWWWLNIYESFFNQLIDAIDIEDCSSIFFWWFLLTNSDFKKMKKKNPASDLRPMLKSNEWWLLRVDSNERKEMYSLITQYFPKAKISFDEL